MTASMRPPLLAEENRVMTSSLDAATLGFNEASAVSGGKPLSRRKWTPGFASFNEASAVSGGKRAVFCRRGRPTCASMRPPLLAEENSWQRRCRSFAFACFNEASAVSGGKLARASNYAPVEPEASMRPPLLAEENGHRDAEGNAQPDASMRPPLLAEENPMGLYDRQPDSKLQ